MPYVLLYKALWVLKVEKRYIKTSPFTASVLYLLPSLSVIPAELHPGRTSSWKRGAESQRTVDLRSPAAMGLPWNNSQQHPFWKRAEPPEVRESHQSLCSKEGERFAFAVHKVLNHCYVHDWAFRNREKGDNSKVALDLVLLFCFFSVKSGPEATTLSSVWGV